MATCNLLFCAGWIFRKCNFSIIFKDSQLISTKFLEYEKGQDAGKYPCISNAAWMDKHLEKMFIGGMIGLRLLQAKEFP